jgi:Flp pilus assembly protein CpaB
MLRRSPRALALWAAAAVVALVTAAVVAGDLAALHRRATGLGPERGALVARHDLVLGSTVRADDVAVRRIHQSQLPPGVVDAASAAVGRVVAAPLLRGQFVTRRNLASSGRTGLDGVVPPGMRAIRVVTTDSLRPRTGARVDVLATYEPDASDARDDTTLVIAAGVLVLATDARAGSGNGRAGALGVTLLVDEDQARDLADAQANGVLTLALVPPEDARGTPGDR